MGLRHKHRGAGALEDLLARLSRLVEDVPQADEVDIKPVIARHDGLSVVDAHFHLAPPDAPRPFLRRLRSVPPHGCVLPSYSA
jgi:ATP-grasp domain